MRAILSAPGSRGDVNPMVAIGAELRRLGYEVVISLAQPYAAVAQAAGLHAQPLISQQRFDELLSDPNVWKPIRGARAIIGEVAGEFLPLHAEVIAEHHVPGETILVSHPLDLASRVFRDAHPLTPLVDVHLAPSMLRTFDSPPRMTPWRWEAARPQWLVRAAYWALDKWAVDPVIADRVNRLRASHSLPPVDRILNQWWLSPDRILAMYPQWYAPATAQFCPRLMHCGFPLHDAGGDGFPMPTDLPIVFTAGTAHHHSREFFRQAIQACRSLGRPGLLVSTHASNFPEDLPPWMRAVGYVSFASLLPHCAAIVHHGGIGTTSQAFAAGVPQIIRPMAFDQFDNATRVERLNCGRWLRSDKRLTGVLRQVLEDDAITRACQRIANDVHPQAASRAAIEIRKLATANFR